MNIQIHNEGQSSASVTMPYRDYKRLVDRQEELEDIIRLNTIKHRVESGMEECFPSDLVHRIAGGENPVKAFREYRELTQEKLARLSGISRPFLTEIELGKKEGSVNTLKKLAHILEVEIGDLV